MTHRTGDRCRPSIGGRALPDRRSLLLGDPTPSAGLVAGDEPRPPTWLVRVLGGRLLAQGRARVRPAPPAVVLAGAAVDAAHARQHDRGRGAAGRLPPRRGRQRGEATRPPR